MTYTMKELADKIGVSQSTVSRVINGDPRISKKTAEMVKKHIDEIGFYPNSNARNLVSGKSFAIGLVINAADEASFSNNFFNRSIFAIEKVVQKNRNSLMILNFSSAVSDNQFEKLVLEKKVDGVILPSSIVDDSIISILNRAKIAFIIMGEPREKYKALTWVDIDNKEGAQLATSLFKKENLKKQILIIDGNDKIFNQRRIEGFKNSLDKNQLEGVILNSEDDNWENEVILNVRIGDTGIVCGNNFIAHKVIKVLKKHKIVINRDVQLITFDNYPLAEYLDPPITAIDVDTFHLGELTATTLFEMISGNKKIKNKYIKNKLFIRDTTGGFK